MDPSIDIPAEQSEELSPVQNLNILINAHSATSFQRLETKASSGIYQLSSRDAPKTDSVVDALHAVTVDATEPASQYKDCDSVSSVDSVQSDFASSYSEALLKPADSAPLIELFLGEPSRLKRSLSKHLDYSIEACYHRVAAGADVFLVNYLTYQLEDYRVFATPEGLEWKQRGRSRWFVRYSDMAGVFLGDSSSTFQACNWKYNGLRNYNLSEADCMTILSKFRSFDFATDCDQIKYDLYLVVAWQLHSRSKNTSIIPLTKSQLSFAKVKMKLRATARDRCLFLGELLLLGIMKTLIELKESEEKQQVVRQILDSKLKLDQKIYRISFRLRPVNFVVPSHFTEKFPTSLRNKQLQRKIAINYSKRCCAMDPRVESSKGYLYSTLKQLVNKNRTLSISEESASELTHSTTIKHSSKAR